MIYKIPLVVARVYEHKSNRYISGHGDNAAFREISHGWFVSFEGSFESVRFGDEKPPWEVGDTIDVTFQKRPK